MELALYKRCRANRSYPKLPRLPHKLYLSRMALTKMYLSRMALTLAWQLRSALADGHDCAGRPPRPPGAFASGCGFPSLEAVASELGCDHFTRPTHTVPSVPWDEVVCPRRAQSGAR